VADSAARAFIFENSFKHLFLESTQEAFLTNGIFYGMGCGQEEP
jgi:hypothetical protein